MIKILSNDVINKIAAGEVVERPASVVKELIENSIDSGADKISIFIEEFGTKKIQVIDNGSGIIKNDFENLFHKHATSKISDIDDLDNINSFGFRGEALASISSVADVIIQTKSKKDDIGSEIISNEGKIISIKPSSIIEGTNIQVINLFEYIPARKKFLKSKSTENKLILETIYKFAICNPNVAFFINIDGIEKKFIKENSLNRISKIINIKVDDLIELNFDSKIKLSGFLVHPRIFIKNKNYQHIFVNNRYVNDPIIFKAIKDGYDTFLMKNQIPGFVLFLDINPKNVDVNVHPRKTEVRFQNSGEIYTSVRFGVNQTLIANLKKETHEKISKIEIENNKSEIDTTQNFFKINENTQDYTLDSNNFDNIVSFEKFLNETSSDKSNTESNYLNLNSQAIKFSGELLKEEKKSNQLNLDIDNDSDLKNLLNLDLINSTQLLKSYILTSNNKEILIIDQHAASERYFYEKYKKSIINKKIESQILLLPCEVELDEFEINKLTENIDKFRIFGFNFEQISPKIIQITEVPNFVKLENFNKIFKEISEDILNFEETSNITHEIIHKISASLACHTAVRFGDSLNKSEINQILKNLLLCEDPYNCPHGRPIIQSYTQYDIEKKFKRCGL